MRILPAADGPPDYRVLTASLLSDNRRLRTGNVETCYIAYDVIS